MFSDMIFYHTTLKGLVEHIKEVGLRRFSTPTFGDHLSDCIFLSTKPFVKGIDYVTLQIDVSGIDFSLIEKTNHGIKVFSDISPERIRGVVEYEDTH